ncbi:hypothetical protein ACFL3F_00125 [Planctomycetota bacterium]
MKLKFSIYELMREVGVTKRGDLQAIIDKTNLRPDHVYEYAKGKRTLIRLEELELLFNYLLKHKENVDIDFNQLFYFESDPLFDLAFGPSGCRIYMGEYIEMRGDRIVGRWISRRDMTVYSMIMEKFPPEIRANFSHKYIPFCYAPDESHRVDTKTFDSDVSRTREIYRNILKTGGKETIVAIGSQKSNHLSEVIYSKIFKVPLHAQFKQIDKKENLKTPVYCVYRKNDTNIPSCFGGPKHPDKQVKSNTPGIYYLDQDMRWNLCEVTPQSDAGIVVVSEGQITPNIKVLLLFGFTGRSSQVVGEYLLDHPEDFWPPVIDNANWKLGVYICKITYKKGYEHNIEGEMKYACDVIALDKGVLNKYARKPRQTE